MDKQELVSRMQQGQAWVPGKRVKLDFGSEGVVLLDGAAQQVSEEDGAADTTIKVSWEDCLHDGKAPDRRRHVERDAASGRAGEAARLIIRRAYWPAPIFNLPGDPPRARSWQC